MDGPWQIGQMQAREYGRKARDAARQMRVIDGNLQLIACGSSGTNMPQYLIWDREVLEECYDQVDGISLHAYYGNTQALTRNSSARYLAMNLDMDRQIREVAAVCDYVQGLRRSSKRLWLSFDEWNVWYRARSGDAVNGRRQFAPKLLEEVYNLEDALLVGGFVNTLLRNADRVRVGCLAQLVNVIAPLVTNDTGVLRQSTLFPYAWALRYARGRVLDLRVESDTYPIAAAGLQADFARNDQVPFVDVVATLDAQAGQACVLMLNRDLDGERELALEWRDITPTRVLACETLTGPDLKAFNTFEQPRRVAPQRLEAPAAGARMTFKLPARSYTVACSWPLPRELRAVRPVIGRTVRARLGNRDHAFQPIHVDRDAEAWPVVRVQLAVLERHELVQIRDRLRPVVVFEDDGLRVRAQRVYLRGRGDRSGEMRDDADVVRLAQRADADHLGDAADVRQRAADEVEVVVLDQLVEIPAGAPFLAGGERHAGEAAQLGDVLEERVGLHRIFDQIGLELLDQAAAAQRVGEREALVEVHHEIAARTDAFACGAAVGLHLPYALAGVVAGAALREARGIEAEQTPARVHARGRAVARIVLPPPRNVVV